MQTLFWENISVMMVDNGVPKMNVKRSMADNAQANWSAI